jgi:hypothetical protein
VSTEAGSFTSARKASISASSACRPRARTESGSASIICVSIRITGFITLIEPCGI